MRRVWVALRIVLPAGVLAYLLSITSLSELRDALRSVSSSTLVLAAVLYGASMLTAGWRWQLTLRACGAPALPSLLELTRLHWIAAFYSTYLPGGLGGEVVRGAATRRLFGPAGLPVALGVVLLERVLGLCALLLIVAVTFVLHPLPMVPHVLLWSGLGMAAIAAGLGAVILAPRLAPHMPGPLRRVLAALPVIRSLPLIAAGVVLSLATQMSGVVTGHLVLADIAPKVTWMESLVIMPLVLAAQYFPLTIAGAGVREAAFIGLYGLVGVAQHDALAASLLVAGISYLAAGCGGLIQMWKPLTIEVAE